MSLLLKAGGITKLSELTIDADKIWLGMGISQIREVAAGMTKGDLFFSDGTRIVKLSPGSIGSNLTTNGPLADPTWSHP